MIRIACLLLWGGMSLPALAQHFDYTSSVGWSDHPVLHTVPSAYAQASAVIILDERTMEFRPEGKEDYAVYHTYHKIIHIRDDKGIEYFNKIYIPVREGGVVSDIRARTILPDGKILDVTPDKVKSTEEDGTEYRQFAMDGVEKGAEVEYYYVEKRPFYLFGSEFYQSGEVPCAKARFQLITPADLKFSAKGYNGFSVSQDSVIGDKRIIAGAQSDIPDLPNEKYSNKDHYLSRVDFKMSYNLASNPESRLYTWKDLGKRAYTYYTTRSDKEDKALSQFHTSIPAPSDTSQAGRIAFLEDYVKTHIDIDKKLTGGGNDLLKILTTWTANEEGVIRCFTGLLDQEGIDYELVLASDRSGIPLDPELEDWDRAQSVLFYFPGTGAYMDPTQQDSRYPYVRANLAGIRGLFLKPVTLGGYKTALAVFSLVPLPPFDSSSQNMEADVRFNATLDTLLIHGRQIMTGYSAGDYRDIYTYLPKDKQDEDTKDIVKAIGNSSDVTNVVVAHTRLTDCFNNTPLVIEADLKNADLIENAGPKLLLKVGELIGIQVEMYQERPRQLPAEMDFPHKEDRLIVLHIPEGYTVKNPEDLAIKVSYPETGTPTMSFISSYTQTGATLTVQIRENYRSILYPLAEFEYFKKVINASADFNKVVLVLEKLP